MIRFHGRLIAERREGAVSEALSILTIRRDIAYVDSESFRVLWIDANRFFYHRYAAIIRESQERCLGLIWRGDDGNVGPAGAHCIVTAC